jgi:hypothetical protein
VFSDARSGLLSTHRVPDFRMTGFKRSQINIHFHSVLALEIVRCSPRGPADAASPILERTGTKYLA